MGWRRWVLASRGSEQTGVGVPVRYAQRRELYSLAAKETTEFHDAQALPHRQRRMARGIRSDSAVPCICARSGLFHRTAFTPVVGSGNRDRTRVALSGSSLSSLLSVVVMDIPATGGTGSRSLSRYPPAKIQSMTIWSAVLGLGTGLVWGVFLDPDIYDEFHRCYLGPITS